MGTFISWFMFVSVLLISGYAFNAIILWVTHHFWSSTTGVLKEDAEVVTTHYDQHRRYARYFIQVSYAYEVNNKAFTNNVFGFRFLQTEQFKRYDKAYVEKIARKYEKGQEVKVYYFPLFPQISVIEKSRNGAFLVLALFCSACFFLFAFGYPLVSGNQYAFVDMLMGLVSRLIS